MASMETQAGSAELLDHSLWYNALTPELYTTLFEVNDLNSQLQEKLYGEGVPATPPTTRCSPTPKIRATTGPSTSF